MSLQIKKATRLSKKIKIALIGISGSGKTYSALAIAKGLGEKVLVVDTEHGSASAYSDFDFDTIELDSFAPQTYADAIGMAEQHGYDVVILDSLSHAWTGKDGAIEQVDKAQRRSQSGNSFTAWKDVTPQHNAMIEAIVGAKCHVIATLRAKTEYVVESGKNGKSAPRKVGLAPIQRDGLEYEFDIVANIDQEHFLSVTKTRIGALDGAVIEKAGAQLANVIKEWIGSGAPVQEEVGVSVPIEEVPDAEPDSPLAESLSDRDLINWRNWARDNSFSTKHAEYQAEINKRKAARENPQVETSPTATTDADNEPPSPQADPKETGEMRSDAQYSSLQTIGKELWGGPERDAKLDEFIKQEAGSDFDITNLTKRKAQTLISKLKDMLKAQKEENDPNRLLRRFWAVVKEKGLDGTDAAKSARLAAVNAWLAQTKEPAVTSLSQLKDHHFEALIDALQADRFELGQWPYAPVVEEG